jgi:hypothetical protein
LVTGKDTVNYVKTQRIKMWGHPDRMEYIKLVENITDWNPIGLRNKGRTENRWRDEVINYLKKLKLRNCSQISKIEAPEIIWCVRPNLMEGCIVR